MMKFIIRWVIEFISAVMFNLELDNRKSACFRQSVLTCADWVCNMKK